MPELIERMRFHDGWELVLDPERDHVSYCLWAPSHRGGRTARGHWAAEWTSHAGRKGGPWGIGDTPADALAAADFPPEVQQVFLRAVTDHQATQ